MRTIVWFRGKDLRVSDHVPLTDAVRTGEVIPLFVLDPYFFAPSRAQALPHRMQFLLESLVELEETLRSLGSKLLVVSGKSVDVLPRLFSAWQADRVVAQRWVEPFARERDRQINEALGGKLELGEGETLHPPGAVRTLAGRPYAVFSHFARAFRKTASIQQPLAAPKTVPPLPAGLRHRPASIPTLQSLGIEHNPSVVAGGARAGKARLRAFVRAAGAAYAAQRDRMDLPGTSRLSADLKFGTVSARQVWTAVEASLGDTESGEAFLNEIVWREFSHSTLWDRPEVLDVPFRPGFVGFPWADNPDGWQAWVRGKTGYPIVDASARQLLAEGFVHNRARMISASFLTKHLLIDYRRGEAHFMKYLVDGDWAQNNAGWQWSAGCGCDAQPYFRVFNPVTQGKKFDPDGDYVRRWVPELANMPPRYIHQPWEASDAVLAAAGVRMGQTYPRPVVEHRFARERFLAIARQALKRDAPAA